MSEISLGGLKEVVQLRFDRAGGGGRTRHSSLVAQHHRLLRVGMIHIRLLSHLEYDPEARCDDLSVHLTWLGTPEAGVRPLHDLDGDHPDRLSVYGQPLRQIEARQVVRVRPCRRDDADGRLVGRNSQGLVAGDQNADPFDGDSFPGAIQHLLEHPPVNTRLTASKEGGPELLAFDWTEPLKATW